MVRYLSLLIVLIIAILAIISRKHYSKYKDVGGTLWSAAAFLASFIPVERMSQLREIIRKTYVLNSSSLEEKTELVAIGLIRHFLIGALLVSSFVFIISFLPEKSIDRSTFERPEAGNSSDYVDLELIDEETKSQEIYRMEVHPRELTDEEFKETVEQAKKYIESSILLNNISKTTVTGDLFLPTKDETGALKISWETSSPNIISNTGKVSLDSTSEPIEVHLYATIKDANNKDEYETSVTVISDENLSNSEKAKVAILEIEGRNRSKSELSIPDEIDGVKVGRKVNSRKDVLLQILVIGCFVAGLLALLKISKLKEAGEKRDEEIQDAYYGFINRLTIYIGAGLTIQDAMRSAAKNERCESLTREIEFALNKIASGISEQRVYAELGTLLGSQDYMRLMSLISQNVSYGNSNLLKLLDDEVKSGYFSKKENMRKKGEQASEKLLLPTSLLLVLVIMIIMYPAFISI